MQAATERKDQQPIDHSGVPVEALEFLRLRLTQITHSLNKLQTELKNSQLSHWVSLQSQTNIILTQLSSLSLTLTEYSDILEKTVVYPIPQFPTTEQEGLLTTLLRKKPLPEVVEWIDETKKFVSNDLTSKDDEELTKWALEVSINLKNLFNFQGFHTKEELDSIDVDKDVELKDFEEIKPKYSINQVLKFMYQGKI